MLDTRTWALANFGSCELGDRRRTKRLLEVAHDVANNPSASLPDQMADWGDLKAAYKLFNCPEVTFQKIVSPHWLATRAACGSGTYLILGDTTELNFGRFRQATGLGPTGNGTGRGFLLHNALMVDPQTMSVIGLAGQAIHYRSNKVRKKPESRTQRLAREREAEVWGKVIDDIGMPPDGARWIHVLDRGADNMEVFCRLRLQRCNWVVRAAKLERQVLVGAENTRRPLSQYVSTLSVVGSYELSLRARPQQAARTAQLEVRTGRIKMPMPRHCSPWLRNLQPQPVEMNVVVVEEVNPPAGITPIKWVLLTSLPVSTIDQAWIVISYYEARWLIEEYHKALKTGCAVESRQLETAKGLETLTGMLSVVAVRLLQLKSLAKREPNAPAKRYVPSIWLQVLKQARKGLRRVNDLTIREFYREVAKLGGFLGRKHDGEPGWITIWRGWQKLNLLIHGVSIAAKLNTQKCG